MDPSMPVISESNGAKSLTGPQLHQAVDQYVKHFMAFRVKLSLINYVPS